MQEKVTEFDDIYEIFKVCDTLHLGLNDGLYPYVVPVCYGVEAVDGKIVLYIREEDTGKKSELIKKNAHASAEVEIVYEYYDQPKKDIQCSYASAVGQGELTTISLDEYDHAMDLILTHYGYEGFSYSKELAAKLTIYKLTLNEVTGKMHIREPEDNLY